LLPLLLLLLLEVKMLSAVAVQFKVMLLLVEAEALLIPGVLSEQLLMLCRCRTHYCPVQQGCTGCGGAATWHAGPCNCIVFCFQGTPSNTARGSLIEYC
jgi:hypothetical protein